jgi:penicillin-binding protein A
VNRSIRRLYLSTAVGFVLLIALLGWWQVVRANSLGQEPNNPQTVQRDRLVDRGRIISADGVVLARSRKARVQGRDVFVRVYPHGSLAPHVVGYVSETQGKTGLEAQWDRYLGGSYGTEPLLQRLNLRDKQGADIRITLDTKVQEVADQQLAGKRGAVVALDPRTGAVLAMASTPGFDLNKVLTDYKSVLAIPGHALLDRATQGRYPPGSTFKVVTAASALGTGRYTPQSQFTDTGSVDVHGQSIRNFGGEVWGTHDLSFALTHSINTTFAKLGLDLGPKTLGSMMSAFGFGERPPIDLPTSQVLPSGRIGSQGQILPNDQSGEDTARIGIGQERLAVTPLQMAMVASAIANGGVLYEPHFLREAVDRGGSVVLQQQPKVLRTVMSPQVAAELNTMMRRVVEEGTGTAAALSSSGVQVAGKTGTAETGRGNLNDAWFIGLAPAIDPKVAVAVVIEDSTGTGGVVAGPIAAEVMRTALRR